MRISAQIIMTHMLGTADLDLLTEMMSQFTDLPFFIKDTDLRYVAANKAMAEIFGLDHASDLIGHVVGEFLPPHIARHYQALDYEVLQSARPIRDRLEPFGSSTAQWLLYTRMPVRNNAGTPVGILAVGRSIEAGGGQKGKYVRLAKALDWLREHHSQPLCVAALAELAGISVSQLERDTRAVLGTTLQAFQHRLRIERAVRLLEGESNIAEIAQLCGYSDQSAFSRRFRTVMNMSPSAWRNIARRKRLVVR